MVWSGLANFNSIPPLFLYVVSPYFSTESLNEQAIGYLSLNTDTTVFAVFNKSLRFHKELGLSMSLDML